MLINTIKNLEMRKIFGKKEIQIIEKQLKGIKLTQSERNRLSRDIRKKFEAIKLLSQDIDEFKLKKGSETKNLIDEIKEVILSDKLKNKIKSIIVFGSFISNEFTFRSDIDISVEFDSIDKKEASKFRLRILSEYSGGVDIQVYNILPEKIQKEILKGKIIYSVNDKNN
ncbi:MAG: nucleotidyltransferase domain-containing protein [archaeon]|nr:nucleotidyltransferase domain-containing protein [archaeon]